MIQLLFGLQSLCLSHIPSSYSLYSILCLTSLLINFLLFFFLPILPHKAHNKLILLPIRSKTMEKALSDHIMLDTIFLNINQIRILFLKYLMFLRICLHLIQIYNFKGITMLSLWYYGNCQIRFEWLQDPNENWNRRQNVLFYLSLILFLPYNWCNWCICLLNYRAYKLLLS